MKPWVARTAIMCEDATVIEHACVWLDHEEAARLNVHGQLHSLARLAMFQ